VLDAADNWFALPRGSLADRQRLGGAFRWIEPAKLREAVLYAHGTIVVVAWDAPSATTANAVMRAYNVPLDGQGGPPGDISPTPFDDGSVLYMWTWPRAWTYMGVRGPGGGGALHMVSESEVDAAAAIGRPTPGEVHMESDGAGQMRPLKPDRLYLAGCFLRSQRTLDAKELTVALRWAA